MPRDDATPHDARPLARADDTLGMAARVAAFDWAATPLGPRADWPAALRVAADLVLSAASPALLAWGEGFTVLHNDQYRDILGPERDALGRPAPEVWAEVRDELEPLLRRARAGESLRFVEAPFTLRRGAVVEDRWFNFTLSPVRDPEGGPGGVLNLVVEVTDTVLAARRRDALIALGDALRGTEDPAELAALATRTLGEALGVARAGFGRVDRAGEVVSVIGDWITRDACGADLRSVVGDWTLADYWADYLPSMRRGEVSAVAEVATDPRTMAQRAAFAELRIAACLDVPVLRDGRLACLTFLHDTAPRAWTEAEIAFARDVAGRVVVAIERAEAVAALRESEDHHRHAVELHPQTSWTARPDGQLDRVNHRWMEWTGTTGLGDTWAEGLHPDDRARTFEAWAHSVTTGEPYDIHHRVKMLDGSYRWAHSRAWPRRDAARGEGGAIVKWYGATEDVHDRFTAREALRESEARFRAIVTGPEAIVWRADPKRGVIEAPGWQALTGQTPEQYRGGGWFDALHPDDVAPTRAVFAGALRSGEPVRAEYRLRTAAGAWRWMHVYGIALRDAEGRPVEVVGTVTDVQDRRALEEARAAGETRLRDLNATLEQRVAERTAERDRLWRTSRDLFVVLTKDGLVRAANPALTAILGYAPEDWLGRPYSDFVHPDDLAPSEDAREVASHGPLPTFENRYRHRDGSWRTLSWVAAPEGDLIFATGRDVTAERAAADALAFSRAQLRTQFETSFALQGLLSPDGTTLAANATALEVIGATEDEVLGLPFAETPWFAATPGMPEVVRGAVAAAAKGEGVRREVTIRVPSGLRTYDFSIRPIHDASTGDRGGAVAALAVEAMDLTERRAAEEALRQAQKMEAVGQLTGGIAHDFNNMLAVVMGGLALLKRRLERGETDVLRYVDAAVEGAGRAAALTQRLLAFSRQQALSPAPLDVNALVAGMRDLLDRTLGARIRVETAPAPDLAPVLADRVQLESAILNLSVNARDAMPEGGTLTIGTANVRITPAQAKRIEVAPGDYVRITVTDTGTGMPPEVAARAFDPFFTTKGVGKGTGLGLSQVFGFVRQSGGHVAIGSAAGRGTTITIVLPRHAGPAPAEEEERAAAADARGETVLVVEDEDRVRALAVESLRDLGYRVLEAGSAEEAIPIIEGAAPLALLFTDMVMPGMGGVRLAEIAAARRPGLRVLFATGFAEGGVPTGAEVLTKPFTLEALSARVRAVLDGERGG